MTPVRLDPRPLGRVKNSTTEPLRSLFTVMQGTKKCHNHRPSYNKHPIDTDVDNKQKYNNPGLRLKGYV